MENRHVVDLNNSILIPIIGSKKNATQTDYVSAIENFERKCEKSLIATMSRLDIRGMVKTDPYSLPYTDEIVIKLKGESYWNGAFEVFRVARPIMKELLEKNIYSTRFYMFINIITPDKPTLRNSFGHVEYRFRYYNKH